MRDRNQERQLAENLRAAGCTETRIETFLRLFHARDEAGQMVLLAEQRHLLLTEVHRDERCLARLESLLEERKE
ncbi:MAG TPA: hypothetical protein H9702_04780 [Candidatus Merdibacter merdavium]|uniref:Uncharacterized protein n=1 Tax=Candidatus Merdibacter merdavium TaxID=2838692 RepID=A0A9D2NSX3_9FIRM|nr:hypothetical protein [Candidatus Merdibacter merdavium]